MAEEQSKEHRRRQEKVTSPRRKRIAPTRTVDWLPAMSGPLTRVISDLHYRDGDCRLRELSELRPLLLGVDHLVCNGDCLDQQRTPEAERHTRELQAFLRAHVPTVTFVTGNHDPIISDVHHLALADGLVWAFHGDILFDAVAPWSSIAPLMRAEVQRRRARFTPSELESLDLRFTIHRSVCRDIHVEFDVARDDLTYRLWRNFKAVFPPRQLLAMIRVWRSLPALAAAWAERYAPRAQVVLVGHSHGPTVATVGDRVVINTGSFCRPRGQLCVDLREGQIEVRPVRKVRGEFQAGPVRTSFPLAKTAPER